MCFGVFHVIVYLSGKIWIQIQGGYHLARSGDGVESLVSFPISMSLLFRGGTTVPLTYTIRERLAQMGDPAGTTYPFSAKYSYNANSTISARESYSVVLLEAGHDRTCDESDSLHSEPTSEDNVYPKWPEVWNGTQFVKP